MTHRLAYTNVRSVTLSCSTLICFSHIRSWDIAQLIPRDRISPSESFAGFLKALRAVTYILVFLLVWICATAGTGCVLLLTAALRRGKVRI